MEEGKVRDHLRDGPAGDLCEGLDRWQLPVLDRCRRQVWRRRQKPAELKDVGEKLGTYRNNRQTSADRCRTDPSG